MSMAQLQSHQHCRLDVVTQHAVALQVYIICREALSDCPSCTPALDTLAQFYLCLACLSSQKAAASPAAAAAAADAVAKGHLVLKKALIADPVRAAYWRHREEELAAIATCK